MSPVSRRRKATASKPRRAAQRTPSRRTHALDALTQELVKLREVTDAFTVESIGAYLLDVVDRRGPGEERSFAAFCQECVEDPRAGTSLLGLQAMAVLAELGHRSVRPAARELVTAADPDLVSELPPWHGQLGRVHLVEAATLRTADGRETVLHVMLDYAGDTGSRHLLTAAVEHTQRRVHLLDVRGREPEDTIAPLALRYAGSVDPIWSEVAAADLADVVVDAVRETARHSAQEWPLLDVEGGPSVCWTLGVRRLEQLTGVALPGEAVA